MGRQASPAPGHDVFVSHSSANRRRADRLAAALEAAGLSVWLDADDIRFGVLLGQQLQEAIRESRALILVWSERAQASPWVTVEWLSAVVLDRLVLPCTLDATPLPQCLSTSVYVDLRRLTTSVVDRLVGQLRHFESDRNQLTPFARAIEPDLAEAITSIADAQSAMLDLISTDPAAAQAMQRDAAELLSRAERRWPLDSDIINLCGYQAKNDFLLDHWGPVQAGRWPAVDPRLVDSRQRFFECLSVDPHNPSALNGLANTLLLQREFDAARFFNGASIEVLRAQRSPYDEAEQDAALIARFLDGAAH